MCIFFFSMQLILRKYAHAYAIYGARHKYNSRQTTHTYKWCWAIKVEAHSRDAGAVHFWPPTREIIAATYISLTWLPVARAHASCPVVRRRPCATHARRCPLEMVVVRTLWRMCCVYCFCLLCVHVFRWCSMDRSHGGVKCCELNEMAFLKCFWVGCKPAAHPSFEFICGMQNWDGQIKLQPCNTGQELQKNLYLCINTHKRVGVDPIEAIVQTTCVTIRPHMLNNISLVVMLMLHTQDVFLRCIVHVLARYATPSFCQLLPFHIVCSHTATQHKL